MLASSKDLTRSGQRVRFNNFAVGVIHRSFKMLRAVPTPTPQRHLKSAPALVRPRCCCGLTPSIRLEDAQVERASSQQLQSLFGNPGAKKLKYVRLWDLHADTLSYWFPATLYRFSKITSTTRGHLSEEPMDAEAQRVSAKVQLLLRKHRLRIG